MSVEVIFSDVFGVLELFTPKPASQVVPEWYKKTNSYFTESKQPEEGATTGTIKRCLPVFDAITAGYIITTYCEIYVSKGEGKVISKSTGQESTFETDIYQWPAYQPLDFHPAVQANLHPWKTNEHSPVAKWNNTWAIKTPKGYSCLFIPPLHRPELPIKILPGIVDTDSYSVPVNFPFFLTDPNFEGFIAAGTPIAQVIPFKRESFKMRIDNTPEFKRSLEKEKTLLRTKIFDGYKTLFRKPKEYK